MTYNSKIDRTSETLLEVAQLVTNLEDDRVLEAILKKRLSHDDVVKYTLRLREKHSKQQAEIESLKKFSLTFNKEYATNHNKCFSTAKRLFGIIRSNMSETIKIFKTFCPKIMEKGPVKDGVEVKPSVIERTMLNPDVPYNISLFGTEGCEECVKEFISELSNFFKDMEDAIQMCEDVLREEKIIREDTIRCLKLYDECCDEVLQKSYEFIEYFGEEGFVREDSISADMDKTPTREDFASEHFHKHSKNEFQLHVLHKTFNEGRSADLTDIETFLWPQNHELAHRVRVVIEHFDELEPKGRQIGETGSYRLSGQYVAVLMKWAEVKDTKKEKHFVEKYFNKEYHGGYQTVASSTVNTAKNNLLRNEEAEMKIRSEIEFLIGKYC